MGYIIGVDLGTSGTKLAARGPRGVAFQRRPTVRGEALAARAVEQFLDWAEVPRNEVDRLVLTGVRTSFFTRPLLGLPTFTVPEFEAIGRGGMVAGVERALVVSMGTATALVMAGPEGCAHLGGSGIGGGTLSGLGRLLLGEGRPDRIGKLALRGRPRVRAALANLGGGFVQHGTVAQLRALMGIDGKSLCRRALEVMADG